MVCDEWGGINFTLFYQVKNFGTIATIYPPVLKVRFLPYILGNGKSCGLS